MSTQDCEDREASQAIVVGVDGSDASIEALRWAEAQARMTGCPLHVITTWEVPRSYGYAVAIPDDGSMEEGARRTLRACIDQVVGDETRGSLVASVIEGHPGPALCEASTAASLVVVGSRGHGAFAGMLLGSVSEFLASHAECPVVIIRHGRRAATSPRGATGDRVLEAAGHCVLDAP